MVKSNAHEAKCIETTGYTYWMFVDGGYALRRKSDDKEHWFPADDQGRRQHSKLWRGADDDQAKAALDKFARSVRDWR